MKAKNNFILGFSLLSSLTLSAAIDPGTYENQTLTDTSFSNPTSSATWIFKNSHFTNNVSLGLTNNTEGADYYMKLESSSMTFSSFTLAGKAIDSTSVIELVGTETARSSLIGTTSAWNFALNASSGNNNASNELRLSGYSDFEVQNFKITSDSGTFAGAAGVVISGASNTFTSRANVFINYTNHSNNFHSYFNISGLENAKSTADFKADFTVRAGGLGLTEVNMKGNAILKVAGKFDFGQDAKNGTANFTMSGSGNELLLNGTQDKRIGSDLSAGNVSFTIGGSNNSFISEGRVIFGSAVAGTGSVLFAIEGSGHSIDIKGGLMIRGQNGNSMATKFKSDAIGISTVKAISISMFDGALSVDLSDFVGDGSGIYSVALISATDNWAGLANRFLGDFLTSEAEIIMGANGIDWNISYTDGNLMLNYTYNPIPEPAAYAAIFGALALAFAAYRRRK